MTPPDCFRTPDRFLEFIVHREGADEGTVSPVARVQRALVRVSLPSAWYTGSSLRSLNRLHYYRKQEQIIAAQENEKEGEKERERDKGIGRPNQK